VPGASPGRKPLHRIFCLTGRCAQKCPLRPALPPAPSPGPGRAISNGPRDGPRTREHAAMSTPAFVIGNITRTPQLSHTGDGTPVVNLSQEHPPACRRRVGRRHDHLLGGGVLRSARRARTSSPRCPAAPARSRSARSAPAPGAATTAASGSGGRSSPTRSALRCAGPPPRSPRPRLGADNPAPRTNRSSGPTPGGRHARRRRARPRRRERSAQAAAHRQAPHPDRAHRTTYFFCEQDQAIPAAGQEHPATVCRLDARPPGPLQALDPTARFRPSPLPRCVDRDLALDDGRRVRHPVRDVLADPLACGPRGLPQRPPCPGRR
jgi:hypothetical protein